MQERTRENEETKPPTESADHKRVLSGERRGLSCWFTRYFHAHVKGDCAPLHREGRKCGIGGGAIFRMKKAWGQD